MLLQSVLPSDQDKYFKRETIKANLSNLKLVHYSYCMQLDHHYCDWQFVTLENNSWQNNVMVLANVKWRFWPCHIVFISRLSLHSCHRTVGVQTFPKELDSSFWPWKEARNEHINTYFYIIVCTWVTSPDSISAKWRSGVSVPSTPGLHRWCIAKNMYDIWHSQNQYAS